MSRAIGHRVPAISCACLSTAAPAGIGPGGNRWRPALFAFLPLCIVLAGSRVPQMQREIRELRKQLVELQGE